jgi:hypothetical protein
MLFFPKACHIPEWEPREQMAVGDKALGLVGTLVGKETKVKEFTPG